MLMESVAIGRLGVSVYQLYLAEQKVGEMRDLRQVIDRRLDEVSGALEQQARGIDALNDGLDAFRSEMRGGLDRLQRTIEDQNAREFEDRTHRLLQSYRRFLRLLPAADEARSLLESAESVERWCRRALRSHPGGSVGRLPYIAAAVFALRANADACLAIGGAYEALAQEHLETIEAMLTTEIRSFVETRSLYQLAVQDHEVLSALVLLLRATRGAETGSWDDGLGLLRSVFADPGQADGLPSLPLRTLPDYAWYIDWRHLDPDTFDLATVREVPIRDLFPEFGLPQTAQLADSAEARAGTRILASASLGDLLAPIREEVAIHGSDGPLPALEPAPESEQEMPISLDPPQWARSMHVRFYVPHSVAPSFGGEWHLLHRNTDGRVALRDPQAKLHAAKVSTDERQSGRGHFTVVPLQPLLPFRLIRVFQEVGHMSVVSTSWR